MNKLILIALAVLSANTSAYKFQPDPAERCRNVPREVDEDEVMACRWVLHRGNKFERWYQCECDVSEIENSTAPARTYVVDL